MTADQAVDLDDCKAKFRVAWPRIRAAPSDADIAKAHEMRGADGDHQHRGDQANLFGGQ